MVYFWSLISFIAIWSFNNQISTQQSHIDLTFSSFKNKETQNNDNIKLLIIKEVYKRELFMRRKVTQQ